MTQPNPSTAQARAIVDELHRHGVDYAVISPGSRSAALALALDEHPGFTTRVALDERSAAFNALGRARVSGVPAVALATSGTALANYLPAVVEADLALVPLILMSADRPPELLHVGANQTIDQTKLFAERSRWSCDLAPADPARDMNAYWRTSVSQVVARSVGHGGRPGPVHLNVAFREPTVPVGDDGRTSVGPYPFSIEGRPSAAPWQHHHRADPDIGGVPPVESFRALVVAGEGDYEPSHLEGAADRLGWPVLATAASGLRGGSVVTTYHHLLVDGVPRSLTPDLVVSVGRIGPSDRLGLLTALDVPQIQVDPWGAWTDPRRHATHLLQADAAATIASIGSSSDDGWRDAWTEAESAMRAALDERLGIEPMPTGPGVARALSMVDLSRLVVASSMPVRDVDAHTVHRAGIIANRGASGIDGFVSTALGAASFESRTVALAGDLSLLHDATGFVIDEMPDIVFLVIDNGGGGLFDLLPQADHASGYERLFVAPHGIDIGALAASYGMSPTVADRVEDLGPAVSAGVEGGGAHVVVVPVDREADLKCRRALDDTARGVVTGLS